MSMENYTKLEITNKWAKKTSNPQRKEIYISGDCNITNYNPKEYTGNEKGHVSIVTHEDNVSIKYGNGKGKTSQKIADFSEKKYSLFLAVANLVDEDGDAGDKIILSVNDIYAIEKLSQEDNEIVWFYDVLKDFKNGVVRFVNYAQETLLRIDFVTKAEKNSNKSLSNVKNKNIEGSTQENKKIDKKVEKNEDKVVMQKSKIESKYDKKSFLEHDSIAFLNALGEQESGAEEKPYFCMNKFGYVGRYQMGEQALAEMGIYRKKIKKGNKKVKYNNDWSGVFVKNKYGIKNLWDYRTSPEKQELLQIDYKKNDWKYIKNLNLHKYVGKKINGVVITESGLLAGAHLVGVGGVRDYLKSNGKKDVRDKNGTPVSMYIKKFAGYEVTRITQN